MMKHLKVVALMALASAAFALLLGLASASATVLCTAEETPCSSANKLTTGTSLDWDLKGSAVVEASLSGGFQTINTCSSATQKATLSNAGSSTETVTITAPLSELISGPCTSSFWVEGGELQIHHIAGTSNGTVTAKGFKTSINTAFGACVYGFTSLTDVGTLTGSTDPILHFNGEMSRVSGAICPAAARWTAEYTFTQPTFYVEPS